MLLSEVVISHAIVEDQQFMADLDKMILFLISIVDFDTSILR